MGVSDSGIGGARNFPSTSWSAIQGLRDEDSPEREARLRRLVEQYWKPVYWVIRHSWAKRNEDAKDLTQEFFATQVLSGSLVRGFAPERGSFRAFLRGALAHFLCKGVRDAERQKRGGGVMTLSLEGADVDVREILPDATAATPEDLFDAAWNHALMERAVQILRERLQGEGRGAVFEAWRRYDLDQDRAELSYADLGRELGLTAIQVKHGLSQTRAALRDIVTDLVRDYVDGPAELETELRAAFEPKG